MFGIAGTKNKRKISCLIKTINKFIVWLMRATSSSTAAEFIRAKSTRYNFRAHQTSADDHFSVVRKSQTDEYLNLLWRNVHTEAIKWSAKRWVGIKNKRRKILLMLVAILLVACARARSPQLFRTRFYRCLWYDVRPFGFVWISLLTHIGRIDSGNAYSMMWLRGHQTSAHTHTTSGVR